MPEINMMKYLFNI